MGLDDDAAKLGCVGPTNCLFYVTHMAEMILAGFHDLGTKAPVVMLYKCQATTLGIAGFVRAITADSTGVGGLMNDCVARTQRAHMSLHGRRHKIERFQCTGIVAHLGLGHGPRSCKPMTHSLGC